MTATLILGAGAREHALAWACLRSSGAGRVVVAPGNPGIARAGIETADLDLRAPEPAFRLADELAPGLVVIGPEAPLVAGFADRLRERGHLVLGPGAAGARLEGSKAFAKRVMTETGVPTAGFKTVAAPRQLWAAIDRWQGEVALKADGLAQGKGVFVAEDAAEARQIGEIWLRRFGRLVVEERLRGAEVSVQALVAGDDAVALPLARDYKRRFDGDLGPNTGGMGAVAPARGPFSAEALVDLAIRPVAQYLNRAGTPIQGVLYAGLMLTSDGPRVLEYNVRFGDPETQVLMPLLPADFSEWMAAAARGDLRAADSLDVLGKEAVAVVVAAAGYPEQTSKAQPIKPRESKLPGLLFWGGVSGEPDHLLAGSGRVATAVGLDLTRDAARREAYRLAADVAFADATYRSDIGID